MIKTSQTANPFGSSTHIIRVLFSILALTPPILKQMPMISNIRRNDHNRQNRSNDLRRNRRVFPWENKKKVLHKLTNHAKM